MTLEYAIWYHQKAARGCFKMAQSKKDNPFLFSVYKEAARRNARSARLLLFALLRRNRRNREAIAEHAEHA